MQEMTEEMDENLQISFSNNGEEIMIFSFL